ncbi:hypothetical protein Naga_100027g43 [Nannochloropsis gaditana]|uniref:Uncharacterized protein n=1 Tax=Nannochloropsis gaditana TaxID=72520 RepID=W7TCJ4_9STRA|nr:hypothetical protein Naga_100027g43 [Nannochloropsis gaditana]
MYSIIVYLVVGDRATEVERGRTEVWMDVAETLSLGSAARMVMHHPDDCTVAGRKKRKKEEPYASTFTRKLREIVEVSSENEGDVERREEDVREKGSEAKTRAVCFSDGTQGLAADGRL